MKPQTDDEKQLVLRRLIRDLARLRTDAGNLGMLAFLLGRLRTQAHLLQGNSLIAGDKSKML